MTQRLVGRVAFVAACAVLMSLSTTDAVEDSVNPDQRGTALGETGPVATVPIEVVKGFAKRMQEENEHLKTVNSALRTTAEMNKAQQQVMVAGGLMPDETAEMKEKSKPQQPVVPPKADMTPEMKNGAKVMGEYSKKNKELEDRLSTAEMKLTAEETSQGQKDLQRQQEVADAKIKSEAAPSEYNQIPFFKFASGAKFLENIKDQQSCQEVCDRQTKCLSYSWSIQKEECLWSVDAVHYDHNYVFMVKAQIATAGDPKAQWRSFPGVKFITAHSQQKENMQFDMCKAQCANDGSCKSFSYRADTQFCAWSSNGLSYDSEFSYFEKDKYSSGASAVAERQKAKIQKQQDKLKAMMAMNVGKEKTEKESEERENELKQKTKQQWLSNQPSNGQETHLKMTVKMEMQQMDAKFANNNAKKNEELLKNAQDQLEKAQLTAIAKISQLEAEAKKAKSEKLEETDELPKMEETLSTLEVDVAKLKSKLKILGIDLQIKQKGVANAESAKQHAMQAMDAQVTATANSQYRDAKQSLTDVEATKADLEQKLQKAKQDRNAQATAFTAKSSSEKGAKQAVNDKEAATKEAIKSAKDNLHQQKFAIQTDKNKAFTAKLVAYKAQEKFAKGSRAQAKVDIMQTTESLKEVKTNADRREDEKKMAEARGDLFKADGQNDEITPEMVDITKILAKTKEKLHKSKQHIKKAKKTKQRQDLVNKLDKLENDATP